MTPKPAATLEPDPFAEWVTTARAAEILGLSRSRVAQLRRERQLKATRSPAGWLYRLEDLRTFQQQRSRTNGHDA